MCGRITDKLDPERTPPDDDIHELLDVIDHPYVYRPPRLKQRKRVKSTRSVVEVHQPRDSPAGSDPKYSIPDFWLATYHDYSVLQTQPLSVLLLICMLNA